jgi:hypothetical protein
MASLIATNWESVDCLSVLTLMYAATLFISFSPLIDVFHMEINWLEGAVKWLRWESPNKCEIYSFINFFDVFLRLVCWGVPRSCLSLKAVQLD